MDEVCLRIVESAKDGYPGWRAELWTEYPGNPGAVHLAGGGPEQWYSLDRLERDEKLPDGTKCSLDRKIILERLHAQDDPGQVLRCFGLRLYELLEETGVAEAWMARRAPSEVRTHLKVPKSLAKLPWKFLARPNPGGEPDRLFNDERRPIVQIHTPEIHLCIVEASKDGNPGWRAELWTESRGHPNARRIAGGGPGEWYAASRLEQDHVFPDGTKCSLDRKSILDKIHRQEDSDRVFRCIGLRLYELLEVTGVAAAWMRWRDADEGRTYLDVPKLLANLPWELLAQPDPGGGEPDRLFNDDRHPIVRIHSGKTGELPVIEPIVRILLIAGDEVLSKGPPMELASEEIRCIRRAFHLSGKSVLLEVCESPRDSSVVEAHIESLKPHVIHFLAHSISTPAGEQALKFLSGPTSWLWGTAAISEFFKRSPWKPRLIFLNACRGGEVDPNWTSLAGTFLPLGIAAVIAAQSSPTIRYAREFAQAFYLALAGAPGVDGVSLDRAMCMGRRHLGNLPGSGGWLRRDWALPVLTVTTQVDRILQFTKPCAGLENCKVLQNVFARPGRFVNRTSERWAILSKFAPALPPPPDSRPHRVVILEDRAKSGLGWLTRRAMRDFLDSGFLVRYARMAKEVASRTSLDVLEEWRGLDNVNSPIQGALPKKHFAEFDDALKEARRGNSAGAPKLIYQHFIDGMQRARGSDPARRVLLVLDRFRKTGCATVTRDDFREGLMARIFAPMLENERSATSLRGVYALLIARESPDLNGMMVTDFDLYGLGHLASSVRESIDTFKKDHLHNVSDEFVEFGDSANAQKVKYYIDRLEPGPDDDQMPRFLFNLDPAVSKAMGRGELYVNGRPAR